MENIKWRNDPEKLLDEVEFERVRYALKTLHVTDGFAIDSYKMDEDGPQLSSVYVANDRYLIEIKVDGNETNFDFCPISLVNNVRITKGLTSIGIKSPTISEIFKNPQTAENIETPEKPQDSNEKIKFFSINIQHSSNLLTSMSYFGDSGEEWIDYFMSYYLNLAVR